MHTAIETVTAVETYLCEPLTTTTTIFERSYTKGNGIVTAYDESCNPHAKVVSGSHCFACTPTCVTYIPQPPVVKDSHTYVWGYYEHIDIIVSVDVDITVEVPVIITTTVESRTATSETPTTPTPVLTSSSSVNGAGCFSSPPYAAHTANAVAYSGSWSENEIISGNYRQAFLSDVSVQLTETSISVNAQDGITEILTYIQMKGIDSIHIVVDSATISELNAYLFLGENAIKCNNMKDIGSGGYFNTVTLSADNKFEAAFAMKSSDAWFPLRLVFQPLLGGSISKRYDVAVAHIFARNSGLTVPLDIRGDFVAIASSSIATATATNSAIFSNNLVSSDIGSSHLSSHPFPTAFSASNASLTSTSIISSLPDFSSRASSLLASDAMSTSGSIPASDSAGSISSSPDFVASVSSSVESSSLPASTASSLFSSVSSSPAQLLSSSVESSSIPVSTASSLSSSVSSSPAIPISWSMISSCDNLGPSGVFYSTYTAPSASWKNSYVAQGLYRRGNRIGGEYNVNSYSFQFTLQTDAASPTGFTLNELLAYIRPDGPRAVDVNTYNFVFFGEVAMECDNQYSIGPNGYMVRSDLSYSVSSNGNIGRNVSNTAIYLEEGAWYPLRFVTIRESTPELVNMSTTYVLRFSNTFVIY
ncbi:hypothetical protein CANCADRAFT_31982 [Tortispora caseinolytica NRRL Y-17796]|uniref:Uncharacterized protein n=1 Tax=Tortispora caseinolytica NRRL Y-17796 TaxID=767744 RepID=A0A1E4THS1_9ASCO|nr:hypothetical protein CANCADRAFT_31982 [Tortispora caseinolytica NRRL Y-17796]